MKLKEELIIPNGEGKSFTVKKGQTLRVIEIEGVQGADLIAFNAADMGESFSAWLTRSISGSFTRAEKLYSKLPYTNVMFTVLTQKDGIFFLSPGRCNRLKYELVYGVEGYHKNCQDILAECIKQYGLTPSDVPEVLNIYMNVIFNRNGTYEFKESPVKKGDYVDLLAEMDCICAISACPSDGVINGFKPKPLGVQIFD